MRLLLHTMFIVNGIAGAWYIIKDILPGMRPDRCPPARDRLAQLVVLELLAISLLMIQGTLLFLEL